MFREVPYFGRLDELLRQLGDLGTFNIKNYALLLLPVYLAGMYGSVFVFEVLDNDYRCRVKECEGTGDSAKWIPFALPPSDYHAGYSQCSRYYAKSVLVAGDPTCLPSLFTTRIVGCTTIIYNEKTAVSDFNLGCKFGTKASIAVLHNAGVFISLSIAAFVADTFGRTVALSFASVMAFVFGILRSFSVNFYMLLALEFLEAGLGAGTYSTAFFYAMEIVGPENRSIIGTIVNSVSVLGTVSLGVFAFILKDWRHLLRVIYTPAVLVFPYIWILDESVRWLLVKGRNGEAVAILEKAGKMNHVTLKLNELSPASAKSGKKQVQIPKILQKFEDQTPEKPEKSNARQVYESADNSKIMASCSVLWFTCTFIYYSLSLNSVFIDGNKYINFVMVAFIEIPANFLNLAVLDKYGRKKVITFAFSLGAISCIGLMFTPKDHPWMYLAIYLSAKFFLTIAHGTIYFLVSELVPAHLRQFLLKVCSTMGRLGTVLAPFTPLLAVYYYNLPAMLFGTLAGSAVFTLTVAMGTIHSQEGGSDNLDFTTYDVQRTRARTRIFDFQFKAVLFR